MTEHIVSTQAWMNMAWIHGEFSPPNVPGDKLPACGGELGKDEAATALGAEECRE